MGPLGSKPAAPGPACLRGYRFGGSAGEAARSPPPAPSACAWDWSAAWPDGRSTLIVEGITLVTDPAAPREVRIDLGDTGYRVQPEHRLRLQVSVSSFPRWPVHPGTDEDPMTATSTRPVAHELHVGGGRKGQVTLTTLPHPSSATSTT